jgi:DNA-binding HxlR family transcriptional regulator
MSGQDEMPLLGHKGLLDVLLALKEGRKTFGELKSILRMSPTTVLRRVRESQDHGWVEQGISPVRGQKPRIDYALTEDGLRLFMQCSSIVDRYVQLREELANLHRNAFETEKKMKMLLLSGVPDSDRRQSLGEDVDSTKS